MPNTLVRVVHVWTCYACGVKVEQEYRVDRRLQAELPRTLSLPDGWTIHDLRPYCGKHVVKVYTRVEQAPVIVVLDKKTEPDAA